MRAILLSRKPSLFTNIIGDELSASYQFFIGSGSDLCYGSCPASLDDFSMTPAHTIPLQVDMFTGEHVDTRSRSQKQADTARQDGTQQSMFSIQEVPFGGKKAKPIVDISHLPSPPLELRREDPRTDEEREADRRKEMEANTYRMFNDSSLYDTPASECEEIRIQAPSSNDEMAALAITVEAPHVDVSPRLAAYHELVAASREDITSQWVDKIYANRIGNRTPLAIIEATNDGLTPSEIACALEIGKVSGNQEKAAIPTLSAESTVSEEISTHSENEHQCLQGLRLRLRQASTNLRTR